MIEDERAVGGGEGGTQDARAARIAALARLAVEAGANVQPGQIVALASEPGKEVLHRAVAEAAYRRGARFVDLTVFDVLVKRARAQHAAEETLGYVPPWIGERVLALGEHRAARIALSGPVAPDAMDGIDPGRVGRDLLPAVPESGAVVAASTTNWSIVPGPNPGWAQRIHPGLDPAEALARLWDDIAHICRLDEPDPVEAWHARTSELAARAQRLSDLQLDALRFEGPGTELEIGLFGGSRWVAGRMETVDGILHLPNLPTEEVFTTPDPERTTGHVRATKPLFAAGAVVEGLRVEFAEGRAVRVEADRGAEVVQAITSRDAGAARLGEVALVDGSGRIGPLRRVFFDTLLDENAASHIAFGRAYEQAVTAQDAERINLSDVHVDFMIGAPELAVFGRTVAGETVPLLRDGRWLL